jgi:hypothetical protein
MIACKERGQERVFGTSPDFFATLCKVAGAMALCEKMKGIAGLMGRNSEEKRIFKPRK